MSILLRPLAIVSLVAGAVGCGQQSSDSASKTSPPPAADQPKKPRGWKAYTGKRSTDVGALPRAVNATVYSTTGAAVELSSLWAKQRTLLVFYRGDW